MIVLIILVVLAVVVENIWSPRLAYIHREDMLIVHYSKKNTRDYIVIVKF
jgi:hypothetical protein